MKILFAIDEAYPLYKIGGLGDVGGSLPKALNKLGVDVRIALPAHPEIDLHREYWPVVDKFPVIYDREQLDITVYVGKLDQSSVPVYLFSEPKYLSGHTDASDNHADKFTVFSLAIAIWLNGNTYWQPQIVHLHDWHTAMVPVILKHLCQNQHYKYITTIHNLAYQGKTNTPVSQKLGLAADACRILSWDQDDAYTNILLEGLLHSDMITTVSPTYAREILTEEYGEKIQEILSARENNIIGILNGIDQNVFNPGTDPLITYNYTSETAINGKLQNRINLQKELGLNPDQGKTMIGFVGRVDPGQKGIRLMIETLPSIVDDQTQFVFLGSGDPGLEQALHQAGDSLPQCRIITRYDEQLAARIYAASDLMIIPSKFEPCGLVQMIAMRYGALPIARKTGGLIDTIKHQYNGFLFADYTTDGLINAVKEAKTFIQDENTRATLVRQAMATDFSWTLPAKEYYQLYEKLILETNPTPA
jgi:starch synthase